MYFHTLKIRFVKAAFIFMYLVGLIFYGFLFFFFFSHYIFLCLKEH